jgi:hypothetical protein
MKWYKKRYGGQITDSILAFICAILIVSFSLVTIHGCTGDSRNELARKKIVYMDGNYKVTHYNCGENVVWNLKDEKITSTDKGYYYFWSDGKYVQAPIASTVIEEIE